MFGVVICESVNLRFLLMILFINVSTYLIVTRISKFGADYLYTIAAMEPAYRCGRLLATKHNFAGLWRAHIYAEGVKVHTWDGEL
jgi:hypothetical protein